MNFSGVVLSQINLDEVFGIVTFVVIIVVVRDVAVVELNLVLIQVKNALFDVPLLLREYHSLEMLIGLFSIDL